MGVTRATWPSKAWLTDSSRMVAVAFALTAAIAFSYLLYLGRENTFWHDEWVFLVTREAWTVESFMRPHNEHWALGVALVWKPLLSMFGLSSYVPFLAASLICHVAAAAAVYRMCRFQAGPIAAFGFGLLFLFLGSGGENLLLAFQLGFIGAAAAGSWALALFLENRRPRLVAGLLLISIATQGPALFFITAIAAVILLSSRSWRQGWVILPALIAYVLWLVTYGQSTQSAERFSAIGNPVYFDFIRIGLSHSVGAITGWGKDVGLIVAVLLATALIAHLFTSKDGVREGVIAGTLGLLSIFVIVGLVRYRLDINSGRASRYGYIAAIFLFLTLSSWISQPPRVSARMLVPFGALVLWAFSTNWSALKYWNRFYLDQAANTRAAVQIVTRFGGSPSLPADKRLPNDAPYWLTSIPSAQELAPLVLKYGSPLRGQTIRPHAMDRVLFAYMQSSGIRLGEVEDMRGQAPKLTDTAGADTEQESSFLRITPRAAAPAIMFTAAQGSTLYYRSEQPGEARFYLSKSGSFTSETSLTFQAGLEPTEIRLPDLDADFVWHVRFDVAGTSVSYVSVQGSE